MGSFIVEISRSFDPKDFLLLRPYASGALFFARISILFACNIYLKMLHGLRRANTGLREYHTHYTSNRSHFGNFFKKIPVFFKGSALDTKWGRAWTPI
jgi:hypothetical protein